MFIVFGAASGSSPVGAAGGVLGGTYPNPTFSSNGTTPILGILKNHLSADVALTSVNTPFDGPSITLTSGQWVVDGHVTVINSSAAPANITAKLWDGVTVFDSAESDTPSGFVTEVVVGYPITVVGTATIKISVLNTVSSGIIKASTPQNGQGNNASMIKALRIG